MTIERAEASSTSPAPAPSPALNSVSDYEQLFNRMGRGFCIIQLLFDEGGRARDALFVAANAAFEEHTGVVNPTGQTISESIPGLEQHWFDFYGNVATSGQPASIENGSESMERWFDVYAVPVGPPAERMVAVFFTDITQRKQAEAALIAKEAELQLSEQRSYLAVKMAHLGTWTFNVEELTADFDERMCEIWGRPASQRTISLPDVLNAIHAEDRQAAALTFAAALDAGSDGVLEVEARTVSEDGRVRWILANGRTRFVGEGPDRRAVALMGTALDVTERRAAEEALRANEARLKRELADARTLRALSSLLIENGEGDALNEALLGAAVTIMRSDFASIQIYVPHRQQLRLLASRNFHPDAAAHWQWVNAGSGTSCSQALVTGTRIVVTDVEEPSVSCPQEELKHFRMCGIRAMQSTPLLSRSGATLGMISTHWSQPYTPSERQLNLIDVIARQAADLLERRESEAELLRALAAKDEFLGLVSHELRTPITTILGNASILQRVGAGLDARERAIALKDIREHADRLNRIVDDLLALARADRGALEPEPLELGRSVKRFVGEYGREIVAPISLQIDDVPLIVSGDPGVLNQVLRNFISNAEKYGAGSPIEIEVRRHGSTAAVCVMDRGIGIKLPETERVFDAFYRAEEARAIGGLGIGLSVCKRLAEALGGHVWAEPRDGGGSLFGLALPIYDEAQPT